MDRDRTPNVTSIAHLKGHVDESGEAVTVNLPRRRKRRKGYRDHVGLVDFGNMARLRLNGSEMRILYAICSFIPEKAGRDAFCTQKEIADLIGVHHNNVASSIRRMAARHVVWRVRNGRYQVSAWLAYNGDFDSWNMEVENDEEPIWEIDWRTGVVG